MGYRPGKGLGKDLQGVNAPIMVEKRAGRGAIGAYGREVKQRIAGKDSDEEDVKAAAANQHQWRKDEVNKKVKYVYKTVDEVISEGQSTRIRGDTTSMSKVKVIDMTGPEQRVLSGYHALHTQHSKPNERDEPSKTSSVLSFDLPELKHNLALLVNMTEQDIIRGDRELRHAKDAIVMYQHEVEKLDKVLENETKQIDRIERLLEIINSLEVRCKPECQNRLSLEDLAIIFRKLQDEFYEEWKLYELPYSAVGISIPYFKEFFSTWSPLERRLQGIDLMKEWKDLLEDPSEHANGPYTSNGKMDPYHHLLWETWMPAIRITIGEWNCRHSEHLVELCENWLPLLPAWVMDNICDQMIVPKLQKEVEEWNPLTDRVPIHAWIHPWIPLLGSRLELVYPTIRHKLSNALINWHPSDHSAKLILEPWRNVFSRGTMDAFLMKNILPKLQLVFQDFIINPSQQILDPWHWVMAWKDVFPVPAFTALLEKYFFPKWLQVLCTWLGHNPNYEEVSKWYIGWKSVIPEEIADTPAVKEQLNRALEVINNALSYHPGYQPRTQDHLNYLSTLEKQRDAAAQTKQELEVLAQKIQLAGSVNLGFKDFVERKAAERGILFHPVPNRYYEAKQVFRFGHLFICIDKGTVFLQKERVWVPTSLQVLLDMF